MRDHLFFDCSFAKSCWDLLKINWDITFGMSQRILRASENFAGPCFMEIISYAAWNMWKERNEIIFKGLHLPSLYGKLGSKVISRFINIGSSQPLFKIFLIGCWVFLHSFFFSFL
jgi:hypothetical protein